MRSGNDPLHGRQASTVARLATLGGALALLVVVVVVLRRVTATERSRPGEATEATRSSTPSASPGTASRSAPLSRDATADLSGKTRAELYELAKEREIPGRSSMNKAELLRALEDTSRPRA